MFFTVKTKGNRLRLTRKFFSQEKKKKEKKPGEKDRHSFVISGFSFNCINSKKAR
jgi:hypothetical protein